MHYNFDASGFCLYRHRQAQARRQEESQRLLIEPQVIAGRVVSDDADARCRYYCRCRAPPPISMPAGAAA